ncbi:protein enhanced disease resistance 2 [Phtheirospermum japonicum]|uniref:Protein enhanced disease resistance 2 n=1 Tax=Phtheirospermum japonicum TaxID=374723 RepID=A0A830B1H9_9LAMI|nr:protein enhanced disease resistance 2 [Phtheirospermum japonicum]
MGVCGSKPKGCVGVKGKMKLPKKRRKQGKRRMKKAHSSINKNRVEPSDPKDLSFTNPAFQGNSESWFDTDGVIESDGEDDFYSIQDDISQAGSLSNLVTPRFANQVSSDNNGIDFQPTFDDHQNENVRTNETGPFHNCGFRSNALRPCLACDECLDVKRKSHILGGSSMRKRLSLTSSFKWKEGQENQIISLAKPIIQRPIAGSQVMCSPLEKKLSESWSRVDPNTFKVRGRNYTRDKKKELSPNYSAYVPFGVDVFLSPRKINHVARHVELPAVDSHGEIPPILVVNLQIPLYQAAIFQNEYDGAGVSYVFYFKLSEDYSEDLPVHFRENFKRIIANETERIKGFPMDTNASYRERLKILGRVANFEDLQLSSAERKLMHAYNEKPVLSRPQHEFYLGENYFEIDLDIHKFSYIARKGFETFQDRIKHCIFDFGLTIQGNKAEDLPECMLCCLRLKEIDYTKYRKLSF